MSRRWLEIVTVALLLAGLFAGQDSFAATRYHRVVWDSDPSQSAVIGFSPDGTSNSPWVEYGFTTDETLWTTHNVIDQKTFDVSLTSHFARLTGLPANSPVYYRACDQDGCGQRFWFKTAPIDNTPFIAVAGGDTRTGWDIRRAGNILISKIRPLFIMHGGDHTNANTASEMSQLLTDWALSYSDDTIDGYTYKRIYPLVPTHGNHENGNYSTLCQVYGVDYNQDSICDTHDTYGAFDVSPLLRVYTLNSEFRLLISSYQNAMNNWLYADLASNGGSVAWRFAQYHKPMFPHYTGKSDNPILHTWWANEFYNTAMNLVVESDTHIMKTTESLEPSGSGFIDEASGNNTGGTLYVGEGSWGAPARSADDPKTWTVDLASIQQLKVITVYPDRLEVRTAQFDATATTLTREQRAGDPVVLPAHVNWWDTNGIGEVLDLKRSAQERSVIDNSALFSGDCTYSLCSFIDASSVSSSAIEFWSWDFGDGTTSTVQHPLHGYAANGKYNVTLTVVDVAGVSHVFGKSVTAIPVSATSADVQIANGDDDVEERLDTNSMYLDSSDLELINDSGRGDQAVGLRFNNITIPQGVTITSADIQFTAKNSHSADTDLLIEVQDIDNAPAFVNVAGDLTDRTMSPVSQAWNNVESWTGGGVYYSPGLSTLMQDMVDRSGWTTGNSMVFKITGSAGDRRRAWSYNGNSAAAAILHIDMTIRYLNA